MAEEFRLPKLGENVSSGVVVRVSASVGDAIEVDQPVLEIETDKAVAEVPSTVAGTVTAVHVKEGDEVKPGDLVFTVESQGAAAAGSSPPESKEAAAAQSPAVSGEGGASPAPVPAPTAAPASAGPAEVEFRLPKLGETVGSGVVVRVAVSPGDRIEADQAVLEIETDKAVAEVPSTVSGTVTAVHVKEGDEVKPGDLIFTAQSEAASPAAEAPAAEAPAAPVAQPVAAGAEGAKGPAEAPATQVPPAPAPQPESVVEPVGERAIVPAAPSTRRFAREIGIDITKVPGTGPNGRISIEDVKAYARRLHQQQQQQPAQVGLPAGEPLPDFSQWGEVERRPMRGVRRKTAEHLSHAWVTVPHVTHFDKADVTELEKLRKKYAPRVEAAGGKLTPTAIILKVVAAALKRFPQFNTSVDMVNHEIIYKKYCHIGVAVDTEHGLLVPVIRDVDKKNLIELSVELTEIAQKTRERKLSLEEMQGGCFTISNLGGIGGTGFTPIVNTPEVAILGVARSVVEPVYDGTGFVPRTMMPLSLSYDHRVIDGADGARFLRWVAEALEQPFTLLLEG